MKYLVKRMPKGPIEVSVPSALLDPFQTWHKSVVALPRSSGSQVSPYEEESASDSVEFSDNFHSSTSEGNYHQDFGVKTKRKVSKYESTHSWIDLHVRVMCLRMELNTALSTQVVSPYPIKSFRQYDDGKDKVKILRPTSLSYSFIFLNLYMPGQNIKSLLCNTIAYNKAK